MAVSKYAVCGKVFWKVDEWLDTPSGRPIRFRQKKVPTREQAMMLLAQKRVEAFEGRFFDRRKVERLTFSEAWKLYEPACKTHDAWSTDRGRAAHLLRHLGKREVSEFIPADVESYRMARPRRRNAGAHPRRHFND